MTNPVFLSFAEIEDIHKDSIRTFGGTDGVRDIGLVKSAIASAENTYYYGHGDLFDIAAAYAFHISESQAFLDGNKRTGIAAAIIFLEVNSINALFDNQIIYDLMMALANKQVDKDGFATALREMSQIS